MTEILKSSSSESKAAANTDEQMARGAIFSETSAMLGGSLTDQAQAFGARSAIADRTRRKLAGVGLGVPVLLTLMSKPALGASCYSNLMSGNLSNPNRGSCSKGWSPGGWMNLGGNISNWCTLEAWRQAGFIFATDYLSSSKGKGDSSAVWVTLTGDACGPNNPNTEFRGGSAVPTQFTNPNNRATMRDVLQQDNGSVLWHLMAAWLNANLSAKTKAFQYILTPDQVIAIAQPGAKIPGNLSLNAFLDSTWK